MELTFETLADLFVATKQTEGCSENTTSWYRQKLKKFGEFLEAGATLAQVNLHAARAFVAHLQGKETMFGDHPFRPPENKGLSAHTIQGYVRTLKSFSSWLEDEGFTEENRLARLKIPKAPKPVIEILSPDEIEILFDYINPNTPFGSRLNAMLTLLLDTGIRAGECCGINLSDVHMKENYLKVFGKGQKERLVQVFGVISV
jgi:site-specific recombinase XerD